jgi:hypothetical protein
MFRSAAVLCSMVFLALTFTAGPARADGVNVTDVYNVTGLLTITGQNACPPMPACAETVSFSFLIGSVTGTSISSHYGLTYTACVIPDSGSFESVGPLGQFSSIQPATPGNVFPAGACGTYGDCNYIGIFDQWGDNIDLHLATAVSDTPIVPDVIAADLFTCGQNNPNPQGCYEDFAPVQFVYGQVEATVTPVPESSSLLLLAVGLCALVLVSPGRIWRFVTVKLFA